MSPRWCFRRTCLLLIVFLAFPFLTVAAIQIMGRMGAARSKKGSSPPAVSEPPKPQLLNADSNPTLRYPVAVWESSVSCGWLDITRTGVSYSVVESGARGKPEVVRQKFAPEGVEHLVAPAAAPGSEEFAAGMSEITNIRIMKNFLQIVFGGRKPLLIYLPQDFCGNVVGRPRAFEELGQREPMPTGTMAVQRAIQSFDSVLAEVKPPAAPSLDVTLHAEPATVEKGRPVALVWTSSNATSLDLEPGVGQVAAAGGISVQPQDSTNYTLTATGPAGTKAASVYVTVTQPAVLPTIVLMEPSAAGEGQTVEVPSSPLIIRGVVMDPSGIPVVTVNGRSVTMRPTSAQAAQFTSDPLVLQPGENHFEVSAINSTRGQAKITFMARLAPSAPKPQPTVSNNFKGLGKAEILSLLQGEVPSARVAELVKERGIKFVPTQGDLQEIRGAGGGDDLIDAINQSLAPAK